MIRKGLKLAVDTQNNPFLTANFSFLTECRDKWKQVKEH